MGKKTHSMVDFSGLSSLIHEDLCCDAVMLWQNLMTIHAKWMCHALIQEIRTIKIFTKYKKYYCW